MHEGHAVQDRVNYMKAMNPALAFQDFLVDVERSLIAELGGESVPPSQTLLTAARHLCLGGGGKRARPLLVRIFGDTVGVPPGKLVEVAAAAELIHSASLLHDDVIDAGMFRRGRPTVNARWGNIVAVMSGDLLLSGALLRLSEVDPRLTASALKVIGEMTRAAIAEVEARGNLALPLACLRSIAEGKTGSLFGWCGLGAATMGGDPRAGECFDGFGRRLGIAFQMADDIRDVTGTDEGKPQYADIQSKTPSLPILLAVGKDARLKKRFQEAWGFPSVSAEKARELGTALLCTGALDEAVVQMEAELASAVEALGEYAQAPGGAQLVGWARTVARGLALKGAA